MEKECNVNEVSVFMFSSKNCPPCRVIKPRVEKTCEELGIEFKYIDVVEEEELYIQKVQEGQWPIIRATPTFFVYTMNTFAHLRDFSLVTNYSLLCETITKIRQELKNPGKNSSNPNINLN